MKRIVTLLLIVGILLCGSVVVLADPGTLPGTETNPKSSITSTLV